MPASIKPCRKAAVRCDGAGGPSCKKTYYQWRLLARAPSGHVGPPPRSGITSSENGCRPRGVSPPEFFAPAAGRLLIGACAFQFVLPAVTVLVKLQNKLAQLINKRAAGDLSILVFIKVAEVRVGEGGSSPTDCCE